MALSEKRQFIESEADALSVALATTYPIELSREFPIETLYIELRGTLAVSGPSVNARNGHWDLIKRVELAIPNGDATNIVDVSGATLKRINQQLTGNGGNETAKGNTTAGAFRYVFPIHCRQPQIQSPVGDRFMINAPAFNAKPKLKITMAAAATDCGTGLTYSAMTISVLSCRRFLDTPLETVRWSLIEREPSVAGTGRKDPEVQLGGSLMGLLISGMDSTRATAAQLAATGDKYSLQVNRAPIREFLYHHIINENAVSMGFVPASGGPAQEDVMYLDFVTDAPGADVDDLGSVLPTNPTKIAGGDIRLVFTKATSGDLMSLTEYRINEDDAFLAKLKRRLVNRQAAA